MTNRIHPQHILFFWIIHLTLLVIPAQGTTLQLSVDEHTFIDQHPNIRVGIDLNYAPLEFMDKEKGHQGVAHDLLTIIAKKTGLRFSSSPNWSLEQLHQQVRRGKLDMLSTQIKSKLHKCDLLYSDTFIKVPLVILARQGTDFITNIEIITPQRIGIVQNHFPEKYLLSKYPKINLIPYHTLKEGLAGLDDNTCDFFIETLPQANHIIRAEAITGISLVGRTKQEFEFGFAVSKELPELQSILNKALAAIPLEEKLQIQQKITHLTFPAHSKKLSLVQIIIMAIIIITLMIIWNRRLQLEIKARKKAESSLQLAKLTLDTIPLHIFWFDDEFNIVMANKAAIKTTGLSLPDLCSKTAWDIDPSFNYEHRHVAWNKVKNENSIKYKGLLKCHDGSIIPTEESLTYLHAPGGDPYVVSIGADIAERTTHEQQLENSEIKLKKALVKAEESSRLKSEFLSNMSHEIRTPLNAIIGYSEMLNQANLPTEQQRYVQTIIQSGKTLITLINDILDLSKLEAGLMKIVPLAINPKLFFTDIISIFEPQINEKNLTINVDLDPDLPTALYVDEVRVRQILFNLIGNGIKFTQTGSITIKVTFTKTKLTLGTLTIAISDTGIGIAQDDQQSIFQSFQQKSSGISRQYSGAGLGLTISKRFVELMGGEILLESQEGKGSCFTITLPEIPISETVATPEKVVTYDLDNLCQATILITDDIKTNRDLIQACLQDTALTILTATNGKEALQIASNEELDLIFMDIKMDIMNGIEATTLLRNNPKTASIPIIALSGAEPTQETKELFDDFLQKPFSLHTIRQKTQQYLQQSLPQPSTLPPVSKNTEKSALAPAEQEKLMQMITTVQATGNLADHLIIAKQLQQYGKKYTNETLKTLGKTLADNTDQGAIIQIEEQLLKLEKYLQEPV